MIRFFYYIILIFLAYFAFRMLLRWFIKYQDAKLKGTGTKKTNGRKYDPDQIQDADFEEIKKDK